MLATNVMFIIDAIHKTNLNNILEASFVFGNNYVYEERTVLRYTDVFINCSVDPIDAYTSWDFDNIRISDHNNNEVKYSQNNSGLNIYNVTEEDQGHYICFLGNVDPLNATILLNIVCKLPNTNIVYYNYICF